MNDWSAASTSSASVPAKQLPSSTTVTMRPRGQIEAPQHTGEEEAHLAHEPMVPVLREHTVDLDDAIGRASGREHDRRELGLVEADVEQQVVELARNGERPELIAGGEDVGDRCGDGRVGRLDRDASRPHGAVELGSDVPVLDGVVARSCGARGDRTMPGPVSGRSLSAARASDRSRTNSSNLALGDHRVDEAPIDGLLAPHALGLRAERVGAIAAHLALVGRVA